MACGEHSIAEQIEHQSAQGEIVDGVCDALRKSDAEDLRFEDRVERVPSPIESEIAHPRNVAVSPDLLSGSWVFVPWGDGGDAFEPTETLLTQLTCTAR